MGCTMWGLLYAHPEKINPTVVKSKRFLNFKNDFFCNFKDVILELKYEPDLDWSVKNKLDNIKVRYAKNSKYIKCALDYTESFS